MCLALFWFGLVFFRKVFSFSNEVDLRDDLTLF